MARKTATIDGGSERRSVAVKTGADALAFYRRKTAWLDPKKIALIEQIRRAKR